MSKIQYEIYKDIIENKINKTNDEEQKNILNLAKIGLECVKKGAACHSYVMCHELKENEDCTRCIVYKMERLRRII